eukprot:6182268-Pleurochrysis_carterae.AAC.2
MAGGARACATHLSRWCGKGSGARLGWRGTEECDGCEMLTTTGTGWVKGFLLSVAVVDTDYRALQRVPSRAEAQDPLKGKGLFHARTCHAYRLMLKGSMVTRTVTTLANVERQEVTRAATNCPRRLGKGVRLKLLLRIGDSVRTKSDKCLHSQRVAEAGLHLRCV